MLVRAARRAASAAALPALGGRPPRARGLRAARAAARGEGGGGAGGGAAGAPQAPSFASAALAPAGLCPGCGVPLQDHDPQAPGFYVKPRRSSPGAESEEPAGAAARLGAAAAAAGVSADELDALVADTQAELDAAAEAEAGAEGEADLFARAPAGGDYVTYDSDGRVLNDPTSEALFEALRNNDLEEAYALAESRAAEERGEEGDNSAAFQDALAAYIAANPEAVRDFERGGTAGESDLVGDVDLDGLDLDADDREFGDFDDDYEDDGDFDAGLEGANIGPAADAAAAETTAEASPALKRERPIVCARCYSLTHRNRLQDGGVDEALMPGFDFTRVLGSKFRKAYEYRRLVVLLVVDVQDFDGSFPREAADLLAAVAAERDADMRYAAGKENISGSGSKAARRAPPLTVCVAANKADLMPTCATHNRLRNWVRERAVAYGCPRPDAVHMVSAKTGVGVKDLMKDLDHKIGSRGDVWILGAQNAGKSSLINSLRRHRALLEGPDSDAAKAAEVTEAHVPGTTIGVLRLPGVLASGGRLFDTPGLEHVHQLTSRLGPEAVKALMPGGRLRPRTWRMAAGQSLALGGVARIEVVNSRSSGGGALYLTAWLSGEVPCHMGKTERVLEIFERDQGSSLWPPLSPEAASELGALVPTEVEVSSDDWMAAQTDVCVAGLGWVGVGVKGTTRLRVWVPEGTAVTTRPAMIPDMADKWERPGRSVAIKKAGKGARGGGKKGGGKKHDRKKKSRSKGAHDDDDW